MNLDACVADYIGRFRAVASQETAYYKMQPSLAHAVKVASTCKREDGKRHSHQRRIPASVLLEAERRLLTHIGSLETATDFCELHDSVDRLIRPIRGVGELTVYDIACRIGVFLNLEPTKVYVHAGTRVGAAELGLYGKQIEKNDLPAAFAPLSAAEIEDLLCIYKGSLLDFNTSPKGCSKGVDVKSCLTATDQQKRSC